MKNQTEKAAAYVNVNANTTSYTNREMYNKSRGYFSYGTPVFHTSDLEDFDCHMTFAKAPDGSIASICTWRTNTLLFYEKVDGKWYRIYADKVKEIQDRLCEKYLERKREKKRMEIKNALKSDFAKITSDDDFIDSHTVGDFDISTWVYADEDGTSMDVRLSLSTDTNYIDGVYEPFELHFDVGDEDDIDSVASEIADYISTAKDVFFRLFQCYRDDNGRVWQLEACDGFECTLVSIGTRDEEVVYAKIDEDAVCMLYTDDNGDTSYIYPANICEIGTVAA